VGILGVQTPAAGGAGGAAASATLPNPFPLLYRKFQLFHNGRGFSSLLPAPVLALHLSPRITEVEAEKVLPRQRPSTGSAPGTVSGQLLDSRRSVTETS